MSLADIEPKDKPETKPTLEQPHDSAYVYSQLKGKHTEAVFPTLQKSEKGKGQWVIIVVLLLAIIMAGWGVGYELQYSVLQPPVHLTGQCPSPGVIENGGCFLAQTTTDANGNQHTVLVPYGHVCKPSGC